MFSDDSTSISLRKDMKGNNTPSVGERCSLSRARPVSTPEDSEPARPSIAHYRVAVVDSGWAPRLLPIGRRATLENDWLSRSSAGKLRGQGTWTGVVLVLVRRRAPCRGTDASRSSLSKKKKFFLINVIRWIIRAEFMPSEKSH